MESVAFLNHDSVRFEQVGFCPSRSYANSINTLSYIIEQSAEFPKLSKLFTRTKQKPLASQIKRKKDDVNRPHFTGTLE